MWKDIPTMLRSLHKGEMYRCCSIGARTYPDSGNLETVNNSPIHGELQTYELGKTNLRITKRMKNKDLMYHIHMYEI